MEATFNCEKVFYPSTINCDLARYVKLTDRQGVLASAVTIATKCGSPNAPYILEARPGQTIQVMMQDFSYYERVSVDRPCEAYAVIKEGEGQGSKTICAGKTLQSHIYTSSTNRIQITIMDRTTPKYFILKYQGLAYKSLT
jgi:hypothetical protein